MNTTSSLAAELRDKEYRDAYVASLLRINLPMKCRALRESRALTQPQLAQRAGMSQPRISEMERPGERKPNIETLLRLASALDVALQVRFVAYSELVDEDDSYDLEDYYVPPFEEDMRNLAAREQNMKSVISIRSNIESQAGGTTEFPRMPAASSTANSEKLWSQSGTEAARAGVNDAA